MYMYMSVRVYEYMYYHVLSSTCTYTFVLGVCLPLSCTLHARLQTSSASCIALTESHIFIGCAEGVVRIFSSKTLHYIASLPRPHFLGVDVAAGQDQR